MIVVIIKNTEIVFIKWNDHELYLFIFFHLVHTWRDRVDD